jgi:hypothetical protein
MSFRKHLRPRLESLEKKTVLSAGASAAPTAVGAAALRLEPGPAGPQLSSTDAATALTSAQTRMVELSGQASGTYTSRQGTSDTWSLFHVHASGAISPIGSAEVTGSFRTLGREDGSVPKGTLTILVPNGSLHLDLTDTGAEPSGITIDQIDSINPGGPMIPASNGTNESTASGTAIIVHTFEFKIISGTGQYAHDRGTGTVQIETTPGLVPPTAPGPYASSLASTASIGRTILNFEQN